MVARSGRDFSAPGSIAAGFGEVLHSFRAMQQQSSAVGPVGLTYSCAYYPGGGD